MSKSKQKGTLAETAVAQYLKQFWSNVERRALAGVNDKGDISGVYDFVIEVKNQKSYKLPEWMIETEQERVNAGVPYGLLLVKPNKVGVTNVNKWWGIMPFEQIVGLLIELEKLRASQSVKDTNMRNM